MVPDEKRCDYENGNDDDKIDDDDDDDDDDDLDDGDEDDDLDDQACQKQIRAREQLSYVGHYATPFLTTTPFSGSNICP